MKRDCDRRRSGAMVGKAALVALSAVGAAMVLARLGFASAPATSESRRLRPGVFLYAAPGMADPNFSETVVLLARYGPDEGAMGLVINRPTETLAEEALPRVEALRGQAVYWGGPVQPEAIVGLVRTSRASSEALLVFEDVYLTGGQRDLEDGSRQARNRARLFSGYAGWSPGQLEAELRRGGWLVARGDADAVFSSEPGALWRKVYQLIQRREVRAPRYEGSSASRDSTL